MLSGQNRLLLTVSVCIAISVCSCRRGKDVSHEDWAQNQYQSDMQNLHSSLDLFNTDCGRYPTTEEGLSALVTDPGVQGWRGPYREPMDRPDPWGTLYRYAFVDGKPKIISAGKDTQFDTADDLSN